MEIDYEKAYKEALERAKRLRDSKYQTMNAKRVAEEIFPQLAESEDERMIKSMTRLVKAFYDCNFPTPEGFERKDLLEWLEKQKEPNQEYSEKGMKGLQEIGDWRGDEGMCKKQKEQTGDIILKAFENSKTDYSLEEREEAIDYSEKVLPTSIAFGESDEEFLLHKVIEAAYIAGQKKQEPAEWSEEDEDKLNDILEMIKYTVELPPYDVPSCNGHLHLSNEYKEKLSSWLKTLRPQPGLSKEDFIKFGNLEYERGFKDGERSHWKPSEEQMCYLKKVYESYDFCDGERDALESLYNDLKKLGVKEEPEYYQHFDPDC